MFILASLQDNVRVKPNEFSKPPSKAITDELNRKYANRVIHDLGLGIKVFDVQSITDPIVFSCQDGSYQSKVHFRLVVFRPFKGEILTGKIKDSSAAQGIRVTLGFFDDIIIPPPFLMPGSEFNSDEGVWVWKYDGNDLFMDPEEEIRIRIENQVFVDIGPIKENVAEEAANRATSPYTIIVSE